MDQQQQQQQQQQPAAAIVLALLRTLAYAKVQFVRCVALDVGGQVRCKVLPVAYLQKNPSKLLSGSSRGGAIHLVQACIGGLPSFGDVVQTQSGLTAQGSLHFEPDLASLRILPYEPSSALVLGNLLDDETKTTNMHVISSIRTASDLCCRSLLQRVVERARKDYHFDVQVGVELEFVLLNAQSLEPVEHSNFADTLLLNQQHDFVKTVYQQLQQQEISVELLHAESAPGQMELVLEYGRNAVEVCDKTLLARQTIMAVAHQHNLKAIFLPKINALQAGNGCHVHVSLAHTQTGQNVFAIDPRGDAATTSATNKQHPKQNTANSLLSLTGQSFMEGILEHLPSLMALTMPTHNSFCRVGPGCWTGHESVWAVDDKEAPLRVVASLSETAATRFEYKLCDSTCNLYLALASIILAGLDGVAHKKTLRPEWNEMKVANKEGGHSLPISIGDSLDRLEESTLFREQLPPKLLQGYLAIRRAEAEHSANMSLADHVRQAVQKA